MITTSRILHTHPRSRLYAHTRDYHRARPGHSSPHSIVVGIQEEDALQVPGDLLAEWDILFYAADDSDTADQHGDVVARRSLRRERHSRTAVVDGDSHPVILLDTDVPVEEASAVWRRVVTSLERGGTLSDVLIESESDRTAS